MSKIKRTSIAPRLAGRSDRVRPADPSRQSRGADAGFSLVEVMISLSLFTIVAVSSTVAFVTSTKYAESTDNRVVAASLAAAQISLARSAVDLSVKQPPLVPPAPLVIGGTTTIARNGTTFTVQRRVSLTCALDHKQRITITVSWGGIGAPVFSDTVRAC